MKIVKINKDGNPENVKVLSVVNNYLISTLYSITSLLGLAYLVFKIAPLLYPVLVLPYITYVIFLSLSMVITRFIYYLGYYSFIIFSFPYLLILAAAYYFS